MKIAVISDIHDNSANLKKFLSWCAENKIKNIICCGDITNSETLKFFSKEFSGKIFLVRGNMEIYNEEELAAYENIINGGRAVVWDIGNRIIGACHEPFLIKEVFSKRRGVDIIFYGHTHKPWIEERGSAKTINPGTLGGVFARATFAVYDTEKNGAELKILDLL